MSVMQRKLFSSNEARTKLRDMGGIMSSFPELSGEVQRFQDGMMVEAPRPPTGPTFMDLLEAGSPLRETPRLGLDQATQRLLTAGMSPEEVQRFVDQGIDLNYLIAQLPSGAPPLRSPAAEEVERIRPTRMTTGIPLYQQAVDVMPPQRVAEVTGGEPGAEPPEDSGMTQGTPLYDDPQYQRIVDLMPPPPEEGDETADRDTLRDRAEARIELFRDLLGEDEPTARDRAMQFAMIGLAVAAGQSPNALTNIANGLLAGTQSMTEQEAARRGRDRELRASAVNSVFDELASRREIESSRLEEMRTGWQEIYVQALGDAEAAGIPAEDGDPSERARFAVNTANLWARARYPDVFGIEGQEPIGDAPANAVRVSSREEVEALEPGTLFVWTDGNVYPKG